MRARQIIRQHATSGLCSLFPEKRAFSHKAVAQLAAAEHGKSMGKKLWVYKCCACKRFHLSSSERQR